MMRNKGFVVAAGGVLAAIVGAALAIVGQTSVAVAVIAVGLVALLALSMLTLARVQSGFKFTRDRMQQDRHHVIGELRRTAQTVVDAAAASQQVARAASSATTMPPIGNTLGVSATLGGIGPEFEFAERAAIAPGAIETFALRAKSVAMRNSMARAATGMQYGAADLLRVLRVLRAGRLPGVTVHENWNAKGLLVLARTLANQRLLPGDVEDAEVLFNAVRGLYGVDQFGKNDGYLHAECLMALGRHREVDAIFRETKVKRRDPVHAQLAAASGSSDRAEPDWEVWATHVNKVLADEGLDPIRVLPADEREAIDRLVTDTAARTVDGPRITVIVPTFNGSGFIRTTLDCLVRQTWRDLEIVVVDDASEASHRERLVALCAEYPEVTLLQQETNQGAYPARNRALTVASGDLVTVHDDDDWSHPQKLEIQARHLLENPEVAANMTRHSRATAGLVFTRINNNPSFSQGNYSSLMFRRGLVDEIGTWDAVNRGADAEFRDRIVALTGRPVEILLRAPLSFTRTHSASLTANEIGRGFIDPSRLFYQAAYERAHEAAAIDPSQPIEFSRPLNMAPGKRGQHLGSFDVVFATDFRFPGGTTNLTLNEIEAAAEAGLHVGMVQLLSPLNGTTSRIAGRALDVARGRNVEVLSLADDAHVDLLLVRHPSVLQFSEGLTSRLSVANVVVVVNNPPVLTGGRGFGFDLKTVHHEAERLLGVRAHVVAESGVTQSLSRRLFHSEDLDHGTWPGFVNESRFTPRDHDFTRRPVLGRHSRDAALKWPPRDVIEQVYTRNSSYDVRILGGSDSLGQETSQWLAEHADVHPFGALEVPEFLDTLDFWSYFHSPELTESFGMSAVEAMAAGLVVILPRYMEENFGDAAVYCRSNEVRAVVEQYWGDPDLYLAQAAKARATVEDHFSTTAMLERLKTYRTPTGLT